MVWVCSFSFDGIAHRHGLGIVCVCLAKKSSSKSGCRARSQFSSPWSCGTSPCLMVSLPVALTNLRVSSTTSDPNKSAVDVAALPILLLRMNLSLSYLGQSKRKWCTVSGTPRGHCKQFGDSLLLIL